MSKYTSGIEAIYPYTQWDVIEESFKVENSLRNETIFALGNGYLGLRGSFEEGLPGFERSSIDGTYINGFYETEPIKYPEAAYAFADTSQTMLNVSNGKVIRLLIEDEPFNMLSGQLDEYQRALRFKTGLLERSLVWTSPQGRKIRLETKRLASFASKHLMAIQYRLTPLNFSGKVRLVAMLDGDVFNVTTENDPRVGSGLHGRVLHTEGRSAEGTSASLLQYTGHTGFKLACAMETTLVTDSPYHRQNATSEFTASVIYEIDAAQDQPITLEKFVAYVTSLDCPPAQVMADAAQIARQGERETFAGLSASQARFLDDFWERTDVEIVGDPATQQGVRFNMFHLLQSAGRDGRTNIAAKGLTGEGYEGHYFWDTETYIIPFFLFNNPNISRSLLEYRYRILPNARNRARQMSHPKGALFPWRTINGDECSAYFPAGTAQYHIDADVAFAIKRYHDATGDDAFLIDYGAEILFETARLWVSLGSYIERKGNRFCINCVTGPDEYSALVDNNCYTNLMARDNLSYASRIAAWMQQANPGAYAQLVARIGLEAQEIVEWQRAAEAMYIPYDDNLQIYAQDDSFLSKAVWDFANTPPENYPLLIHYHPLVIYRHQVSKQADLVLALYMLSHTFTQDEKKRNYDYYEKVTTHDSSLSTCIFSIVGSEIGYHDKAYDYFVGTARMDLDDFHGNVKDGIHAANMAGTWLSLVNGFAGMRAYDDVLSFNPYLPGGWQSYSFKVTYRGCLLKVSIDGSGTAYDLLQGDSLTLHHKDQPYTLTKAEPRMRVG